MASKNYIPTRDAEFANWALNLNDYIQSNLVALGITAAQGVALSDKLQTWSIVYPAHLAAILASKSATEAKKESRRVLQNEIRYLVKEIQNNPNVTDAQRDAMGITIPKTTKTPVPVPTSRPVPAIEDIEEFTHTLRIRDDDSDKAAKPSGVDGAEIWMKIVPANMPAPSSPADLVFSGYASKSTVTKTFEADDNGKTAYYRLRWVNTKGEVGPWGTQVGATIAA